MGERKSAAGRKPLPDGCKRVQITITIEPATAAWLRDQTTTYSSIGAVIDRLVQRGTNMNVNLVRSKTTGEYFYHAASGFAIELTAGPYSREEVDTFAELGETPLYSGNREQLIMMRSRDAAGEFELINP